MKLTNAMLVVLNRRFPASPEYGMAYSHESSIISALYRRGLILRAKTQAGYRTRITVVGEDEIKRRNPLTREVAYKLTPIEFRELPYAY